MIAVVVASLETGKGRIERSQGGVIVVGRDARCGVVLDGRGVSGTHFRLSPMPELPGAYLLEDLASTYGTFVNNARVGRPVVVSGRDVITVGGSMLMLAQPGQEKAAIERLSELAAAGRADASATQASAKKAPPKRAAFDPRAPWMEQFEYFDGLARSWHDSGRPKSKLLEGAAVTLAERWLAAGINQSPAPGALHADFIEQSRNRRVFRLQIVIALVVVGLLVIGATVAAILYRQEIAALLVPPEAIAEPEPEDDGEPTGEDVAPVDLRVLVDAVQKEPDGTRRLLLLAAIADIARAQGKPLLSEGAWDLLRACQGSLAERRETVLLGHTGGVTDVAFSPDGLWVASASDDGSARVWDFSAPSPGASAALRGHLGRANIVAFSPDGNRLATGGDEGNVYVWRLDTAEPGTTGVALEHHQGAVRTLAWHPDGKRLVSGDDGGEIAIWRLDAPDAPASTRSAHEGPITALVFDRAEPPFLFSGSDDRLARQWTLSDEDDRLRKVRTFDEHVSGVTAVAVSDDERWAATATTSGELMLWPRGTRRRRGRRGPKTLPPIPLIGHADSIAAVAFTPDGRWLISGGDNGLRMWDLRAKDPGVASISLTGHSGEVRDMVLAAGNRAVTGATDNLVRVWDLEASQKVLVAEDFEGHTAGVSAVGVSPDGLRLVSGAEDTTVRVWDAFDRSPGRGASILRVGPKPVQAHDVTRDGLVLGVSTQAAKLWTLSDRGRWRVPTALEGFEGFLSAGALDDEGERAAVGTEAGVIFVWSLPKRRPVRLEGHTGSVNQLEFLPDGRLVSVSSDRTVRVWDVDDPQAHVTWAVHADEVHSMTISGDGAYVFTGGLDGGLLRWTVDDGTVLPMRGHEGEILQLRLSPDGKLLASASADRRAFVWDVEAGTQRHVMRGHDEAVQAVAFARSRWLATGGADARVLVWDLESEHPEEAPRALIGHEQSVTSLAFTRDSSVLASGSNDQSIRLWRLDSDRSVVLRGHDGVVAGLTLADDGAQLVSSGFDGTVRVWPLSHESLERVVCDVVGETLEPGEASKVLGVPVDDPCATGRR